MIVAADPGLEGALAALDRQRRLAVYPMPTAQRAMAGGKSRRVIDEAGLLALLQVLRDCGGETFFVEEVEGRRGQAAGAAFSFGYGAGLLRMAARSAGFVIEPVRPAGWKGAMRVSADKETCRHRASELFPAYASLWPRKGDDGKAEAALLALYGARRTWGTT